MHLKHPKKEVNAALDYADSLQLTVERTAAGHKGADHVHLRGVGVGVVDSEKPREPRAAAAAMG